MRQTGRITRVGGTCAPNTMSASTLAAVAAPVDQIEDVAAIINEEPGVNHSYEREDDWNIWFVATGPDRGHVDATLARIEENTGLRVLDLRLVRPFNVDLGLQDGRHHQPGEPARTPCTADLDAVQPGDRDLMQALCQGLPIVPRPYQALAESLGSHGKRGAGPDQRACSRRHPVAPGRDRAPPRAGLAVERDGGLGSAP